MVYSFSLTDRARRVLRMAGVGCAAAIMSGLVVLIGRTHLTADTSVISITRIAAITCGDGVLDPEEECDEGKDNGKGACTVKCTTDYCGDGRINPEKEECEPEKDEEGAYVYRACGTSCTVPVCDEEDVCTGGCERRVFRVSCDVSFADTEQGSSVSDATQAMSSLSSTSASFSSVSFSSSAISTSVSFSAPPPPAPRCGDALRQSWEQCDDGADNSDTIADSCRMTCRLSYCGDGVIDTGEECDDGNDLPGDGCAPGCRLSVCGNGALERGEECDDGPRNTDTQPNACSTTCALPRCGNGLVDTAYGEECDDGNAVDGDGCSAACVPERRITCADEPGVCSGMCGDGILNGSEQCDDGNGVPGDGCSAHCTVEVSVHASASEETFWVAIWHSLRDWLEWVLGF